MTPKRSPWPHRLRNALSTLLSLSLTLTLVPNVPAQAAQPDDWADSIDAMLVPGEYIEGEVVVALAGAKEDALTAQGELPADVLEPLMEVSSQAVTPSAGGLTAQSDSGVTLALVSSENLTTEELLRSLADDPRVVFAEPNYVGVLFEDEANVEPADDVATSADEASASADEQSAAIDDLGEAVPDTSAQQSEPQEPLAVDEPSQPIEETTATEPLSDAADLRLVAEADSSIADLTPLQWANWDTRSSGIKPTSDTPNSSMNVPAFGSDQVGANMDKEVVIAIVDNAVDFTNPDLADRAYTFSPELQAKLGCDVHGFNASADSTNGKLRKIAGDDHGTHCAGIAGASWDGRGISGVASNARIVSIQNADSRTDVGNNRTSLGNILRAYDFVKRANDEGVGIKVTSNSWGFYQSSKAIDAAVRELGETQGVVTVFSAGNDSRDNNISGVIDSTYADNPYAITVAATDQTDALATFTSYGDGTASLAAPGVGILSTVFPDEGMYLPSATPDSNILYEDFEDGNPIVTIQQIDADGNLVSTPGTVSGDVHFNGSQGVAVPVDTAYDTGGESFFSVPARTFRFDFDLAAAQAQTGIDIVQSLKQAKSLYFGVGVGKPGGYSETSINNVMTNITGDAELTCEGPEGFVFGPMSSIAVAVLNGETSLDLDSLDGHLIVDLKLDTNGEYDTFCFDTVGLGTQKAPYGYKSGTSMSCPGVAGAAAVLSAQTGLEGAELASLVCSKIRIPEDGPYELKTGGVFDFAVSQSPESGESQALAPHIASLTVSGNTVTITGTNFGSKPGVASLARSVIGKQDAEASATVTSWSDDQVVLELDKPFVGILRAELTNVAGKRDIRYLFVSKGENIFEQDLPFASSTGEPFAFDDWGDFETKGPLVGLGCKLYYLPASQTVELSPAYRVMRCFDLKTETWSDLPDLPEPLQGVSAVMHEGKIVVEGATMQTLASGEPTDEFVNDEEPEERVYVFDPATLTWSRASNEGMVNGQTLFSDNGKLRLIGGFRPEGAVFEGEAELPDEFPEEEDYVMPALEYDLSSGIGKALAKVRIGAANPTCLADDGVFYVLTKTLFFARITRDKREFLDDGIPEIKYAKEDEDLIFDVPSEDPFVSRAALVRGSDGILLTGLPAADGSSDTFIMRDGSDTFEPYEKRISDARVQSIAACAYRGRLFVIGSSWVEPNQRIFRATAMDVPEQPGDIPCGEKEDPKPTPTPKPTPDTGDKTSPASSETKKTSVAKATTLKTSLAKTGDETPYHTVIALGFVGTLLMCLGLAQQKRKQS